MKEFLAILMGAGAFISVLFFFDRGDHGRLRRSLEAALRGGSATPPFFEKLKRGLGKSKRTWALERSLPDFWDLLALGLSSGLPIQKAFDVAFMHLPGGVLKKEMSRSLRLMTMGGSFETVMAELSSQLESDRTAGSFSLILQSIRSGSPLQDVLFDQAAALRRSHMMALEKKAQTVGLRLLFPVVIFIFPTVFVLLFGALYLSFIKNGSLF